LGFSFSHALKDKGSLFVVGINGSIKDTRGLFPLHKSFFKVQKVLQIIKMLLT